MLTIIKKQEFRQIKRLSKRSKRLKVNLDLLEEFVSNRKCFNNGLQKEIRYLEPDFRYNYCAHYNSSGKMFLGTKKQWSNTRIMFWKQFLKKHRRNSGLFAFGEIFLNLKNLYTSFTIGNEDVSTHFLPIIEHIIRPVKTSRTKIIILLFAIDYPVGAHSNLIVINSIKREFVIFEPLGKDRGPLINKYDVDIEMAISHFMRQQYQNYKLIETKNFVDCLGVQIISDLFDFVHGSYNPINGGFCLSWCFMYGMLTILNPKASSEDILSELYLMTKIPFLCYKFNNYLKKYWNEIIWSKLVEIGIKKNQ